MTDTIMPPVPPGEILLKEFRLRWASTSPAPSVSSPAAAPPGRPPRCDIVAVATATLSHRGGWTW